MKIETYNLFDEFLKQTHLLVAGATGSGKSVVINGIIYNAMCEDPEDVRFILIDPKRVELSMYRDLPHTICYASEPDDMINALERALHITESRYSMMQKQKIRKYRGAHVYVIIDELAQLMTTKKAQVAPLLQQICQIGRAANVHVIAATQCPTTEVIPTAIKVNFDSILGLRTKTRRHSYNIIDAPGLEKLPRYGKGVYCSPDEMENETINIPMYSDEEIETLVSFLCDEAATA